MQKRIIWVVEGRWKKGSKDWSSLQSFFGNRKAALEHKNKLVQLYGREAEYRVVKYESTK